MAQRTIDSEAVTFPQVHRTSVQDAGKQSWAKANSHRVVAFVFLRDGNDSICRDKIEQRSSEPSRAVTRCTSVWLECEQGPLSSSSTQQAPCQTHTVFPTFATLMGSAQGRAKRSAVHNDSHYVWCISSQDQTLDNPLSRVKGFQLPFHQDNSTSN